MDEKHFEYSKPHETENRMHRIDLNIDGENVGYAEMEYHSEPFPFYYLSILFVRDKFRNKKYGKEILLKINEFLDSRDSTGILVNSIDPNNLSKGAYALGMYEKYGWVPVVGHESYNVYGSKEFIDSGKIYRAIQKIRESDKRRYSDKSGMPTD